MRIQNQTDQILSLITSLNEEKINVIKTELKPIKENINEIKEAIYGNGTPGLMKRMNEVESTQKNILAKFAGFTVFFGMVFTAIFEVVKGFMIKRL